MKPTESYENRFHFFVNDGKEELNVTCFQGLLNAQSRISEKQYIRAFLGFIELGMVEALPELELVRIGGRGLSKFASEKTENRYLFFDTDCFDKMVSKDISLKEFLQLALPEVIFHLGREEDTVYWSHYNKEWLARYIRYSHPQFSCEELQKMRESETRVIFWDLADCNREILWFTVESEESARWENRLDVKNVDELRKANLSNEMMLAFLGNILLGAVWYVETIDAFVFGGTESGLGRVFPHGEDCFLLNAQRLDALMKRNISLEEFVHVAYNEFNEYRAKYEISVVDNAEDAWRCMLNGWSFVCRDEDIMHETGYTNTWPERLSKKHRVIFVKAKNS